MQYKYRTKLKFMINNNLKNYDGRITSIKEQNNELFPNIVM